MNDLLRKIENKQAVVSVIGLGYVGLPLAMAFATAGYRVIGIDADEANVQSIISCESYIHDGSLQGLAGWPPGGSTPDGEHVAAAVGTGTRLLATTDYGSLEAADVVIVCVPTPLSKTGDPDLSYVIAAADGIASWLHLGMLVILESTGYPGMTEEVILPRLQDADGMGWKVGRDFFLAFSPERIDPGRTDWTIKNTPKLVGGVTPSCLQRAEALYSRALDLVVPVSSPKVAEMAKLLENTFRATNIALVNEIAMMCDRLGVDVWEAIEAAKTKPFGFMPFYPGPGLGGHCIPVDPQYLAWKLKTLDYNARFIQLAAEINMGMPAHVAGRVADALNDARKPMNGSRVLLLGVAYKPNVADIRESPALDLIELLQGKGVEVTYNDPYVAQIELAGSALDSVVLDEEVLKTADCVVITTDHAKYDWQWVVDNSQLIIDTRNATGSISTDKRWTAKV
jgi:UDP-N-acetyl-D-glucosamine dehydrogenase